MPASNVLLARPLSLCNSLFRSGKQIPPFCSVITIDTNRPGPHEYLSKFILLETTEMFLQYVKRSISIAFVAEKVPGSFFRHEFGLELLAECFDLMLELLAVDSEGNKSADKRSEEPEQSN